MAQSKGLGNVFKLRDIVDVRDPRWGAKGDGTTDDTTAIQNAIDYVRTLPNGVLYFPPNDTSQYYQTTAALTVDGPIKIEGAGPNAVTILATGLSAGQYVLDINCDPADVVEHLEIDGITLRSNNGTPNGLRIKNASYVIVRDVELRSLTDGLTVAGTRCFSNKIEMLVCNTISGNGVKFASYSGGGHWLFDSCTFSGAVGFAFDSSSTANNLSFNTCNFEQCTTQSMLVEGTVEGFSMAGCRTEGCNADDFVFYPASGKHVTGLSITGGFFNSDSGANYPISLGGNSGTVRGFLISGNNANITTSSLVRLNGEGESGVICGNYINTATGGVVSAKRAGVIVFGNENTSGKLDEAWGETDWSAPTSFTPTDASGAGLTFTQAAGHYSKVGPMVFWQAVVVYPATADTNNAAIGGLPFAVTAGGGSQGRAGAHVDVSDVGSPLGILQGVASTTSFSIYDPDGLTNITNATLSGKSLYMSGHYCTTT